MKAAEIGLAEAVRQDASGGALWHKMHDEAAAAAARAVDALSRLGGGPPGCDADPTSPPLRRRRRAAPASSEYIATSRWRPVPIFVSASVEELTPSSGRLTAAVETNPQLKT